jgi:copper homeostasis protein
MQGIETLAQLQAKAGKRISIMAGGGIRPSNVRTLALKTGVGEVHSSLSRGAEDSLELGSSGSGRRTYLVLEDDVRAFKAAVEATPLDVETDVRS